MKSNRMKGDKYHRNFFFMHIETVPIEHLNSLGGFVTAHMYVHNAFD